MQCTARRQDCIGAGALQSQIGSVRASMDRLVKTSPAVGLEDVAASGPEHSVVGAVEVDPVSETATAQRILALQSQLDLVVRAQDFGLAVALQSQIAAARQAGDAQGKMKAGASHEAISSTCPGRAAAESGESVDDKVAAQRICTRILHSHFALANR